MKWEPRSCLAILRLMEEIIVEVQHFHWPHTMLPGLSAATTRAGKAKPQPAPVVLGRAEDGQGMITADIPTRSHVCAFTDPIILNLAVFQTRNSPPGVIAFPETSFHPPGQPELGFRRQDPCTHRTALVGFLGISKA